MNVDDAFVTESLSIDNALTEYIALEIVKMHASTTHKNPTKPVCSVL